FICPAARLGELAAFRDEIGKLPSPLVISALGCGGKDSDAFVAGVREDLAHIARFRESLGDKVTIDIYETKFPAALFPPADRSKLLALVQTTASLLEQDGPGELTPFFEPPSARRDIVELAVDVLAADRNAAQERERCRPAGLKVRCGGADAS